MFRSLAVRNYRIWASGAIVSNVGTWMQRTAQDWIVLTQLTRHNATAVGIVLAFQFAPQVLLLPVTGLAADRLNRRRLLMASQSAMATFSLVLGLLTVTGAVRLWQVYVFAFLFGSAAAFDSPARQTFVAELVEGPNLSNALALNTTSFNAARTIGPAVAGVLIAVVGTGWVFVINAASYVAVLGSLFLIRVAELHLSARRPRTAGDLAAGFRYVLRRPDLKTMLLMFFLVGTFGANFQIFIPTMSVSVFHRGAGAYGLLSSFMAVGSVCGALLAARRENPRITLVLAATAIFAAGLGAGALAPTYLLFALALVIVGVATPTFTTSTFSLVQLSTDPAMRGRVVAIMLAVGLGGIPIGAPVIGMVGDAYGPRWAVAVGAASGVAALGVGACYVVRYRQLRVRFEGARLRVSLSDPVEPGGAAGGSTTGDGPRGPAGAAPSDAAESTGSAKRLV
ncbi:MFS transporter [Actinacidiphila guanduensis]|uniref:Predicted arabinose efflux permease, MFS family n=1 Tax=Actinacidiphila guanduensis TaxID=310781 RepID=A0A1G9VRT2_9ACTN|nr:MFS transporter [Actinacidiphila guanduensis]SDM74870.1 Predicted arabinose efflux permease, MFS family [Actinacidiphila guanduensis]